MFASLFIAGTDTGVGKTLVTALIALKLRQAGVDAGVMKPFASGCGRVGAELVSEDAVFLKTATGVADDLDLINPIRLEEPLAPLVAARRAGVDTSGWKAQIREAYLELRRRHECVLVEGVGGLLVPVGEENGAVWTCVDLITEWMLPVTLVARRRLGTINHVLLTASVPLPPPARFESLIFCDAEPVPVGDVAAETSPDLLAEITGLPIWGRIPHLESVEPGELGAAMSYLPGLD
jgi:dethiobiotin synthetase